MLPIAKSMDSWGRSIAEAEVVVRRWAGRKAASVVLISTWGDVDRTFQKEEWKTSSFFTSIVVPLFFRKPLVVQMPIIRWWRTQQLIRIVLQQQSSEEVSSHLHTWQTEYSIFCISSFGKWLLILGNLDLIFLKKYSNKWKICRFAHNIVILCWGYTNHVHIGSFSCFAA